MINQTVVDVAAGADTTALAAVRDAGLTGTKEGCASGDCGACTVLIGEADTGEFRYRTANACILPVEQLAGKHLVTVEGLADDKVLHPAQQAMVDCHASQCGFCTPGFVMSLAGLLENEVSRDREQVLQGISGNLCRCTGYRPIVDAGLMALEGGAVKLQRPGPLPPAGSTAMSRPKSEAELQLVMKGDPGARLIAGGTDLMLEVTQLYRDLPRLVDLSGVDELRRVAVTDESVVIGAAVTYSTLESELRTLSVPLQDLLLRLGSRQIRNSGTIGGNLANGSPIADMPPALMVWDAVLELVSSDGPSRSVPVADFYTGYRQTVLGTNEYVARIHIPRNAIDTYHRFYKSSKRIEDDISSVMGAFRFTGDERGISQARVAYGGMAATPVRLPAVESLIEGRDIDETLITSACELLHDQMTPMSDVRASAAYRSAMAGSMLERALRDYSGDRQALVMEADLDA